MSLDNVFAVAVGLGALGLTVAVFGVPAPGTKVSRETRGDLGRLWGAVLGCEALLLVGAGVYASDPDGTRWPTVAIIGAMALTLAAVGIRQTRLRVADDRKRRGSWSLTDRAT